jgi:hypothetical protein
MAQFILCLIVTVLSVIAAVTMFVVPKWHKWIGAVALTVICGLSLAATLCGSHKGFGGCPMSEDVVVDIMIRSGAPAREYDRNKGDTQRLPNNSSPYATVGGN